MSEPIDRRVADIVETAEPAPELSPGWEARARARMVQAQPAARASRLRLLLTACGVALILFATAFVPYSANQAGQHLAAVAAERAPRGEARGYDPDEGGGNLVFEERVAPYRASAPTFVAEHYPNYPQMLLGAAVLARDAAVRESLLKKAMARGGGPMALACYVWYLTKIGPHYEREPDIASDPEKLEEAKRIRASFPPEMHGRPHLPDRLPADAVAPILAAIREWQRADPGNALPVAVEAYYLYGLHRDREVLARWQEAARRTEAEGYERDWYQAAFRLLTRMGMSSGDAMNLYPVGGNSRLLWRMGQVAHYEGRRAQLAGRPQEAIGWWAATMRLGRNLQASGRSDYYRQAVHLEASGAAPAWQQYPVAAGVPGQYAVRYGPQHEFYAREVGPQADAEVRDRVVLGKVRLEMWRAYLDHVWSASRTGPLPRGVQDPYATPRRVAFRYELALEFVALLAPLVLLYAGVGLWRRASADGATGLRARGALLLAAAALLPVALGGVALSRGLVPNTPTPFGLRTLASACSVLPPAGGVAAAVLLCLLAVRWSRRAGARWAAAWRGNLRRVLPLSMLLCAALGLLLALSGRQLLNRWAYQLVLHPPDDLAQVRAYYGDRWEHPVIPPDSWRAEYPPPPAKGPGPGPAAAQPIAPAGAQK